MVFGWIKGRGSGGYRTLAGPVTRFTVARTTMRDAGPSRAKDGDGVMAEHPSNPWNPWRVVRGLAFKN